MYEHGCTGFTNVRWAVAELLRESGYQFGIYLDVDMLVTGDVEELFQYRKPGCWVTLQDGSTEVSVICSSLRYPPRGTLHLRHKGTLPRGDMLPLIPTVWNCEDKVKQGMRLLHFTDLNTQPWFYDHPDEEAVELYESYRNRYWAKFDPRLSPSCTAIGTA
jgi:hypothetical protein